MTIRSARVFGRVLMVLLGVGVVVAVGTAFGVLTGCGETTEEGEADDDAADDDAADDDAADDTVDDDADDVAEDDDADDDVTDDDGTDLPALTDADLDDIAPCPNQALLTDDTFLADLAAAEAFTLVVNEETFPDTICSKDEDFALPEACQGESTDCDVLVTLGAFDFNHLVLNDDDFGVGVDVCGNDPMVASFPHAGTYRRDVKFTANGRSYRIRMRAAVVGRTLPDAGDFVIGRSFADFDVDDLEADLGYTRVADEGDTLMPEDETLQATLADLVPSADFEISLALVVDPENTPILDVTLDLICAQQL